MQVVSEDSLGVDWESKAILVVVKGTPQDQIQPESILGITREGVNEILKDWATYKMNNYGKVIPYLFMYKEGKPPTPAIPTIADEYLKRMGPQVKAIADLHHALSVSRNEKDTPGFTATLPDKFAWGRKNVKSIQNLTVETMLDWIVNIQ